MTHDNTSLSHDTEVCIKNVPVTAVLSFPPQYPGLNVLGVSIQCHNGVVVPLLFCVPIITKRATEISQKLKI